MRVLVDTPVWSLALRRSPRRLAKEQRDLVRAWGNLIRERRIVLIGPVRQEILSGVRGQSAFDRLRDQLRAFDDEPLTVYDYEQAAHCYNTCRAVGVAGSSVDFLLCAVALGREVEVLTTDADFTRYAKHLPIRLHEPRATKT